MKAPGGSFGFDAVVAAVLVSLLVHAGLMFWMRSQPLTEVLPLKVAERHRTLRMVKSPPRSRPLAEAELADVEPARSAPEAEAAAPLPTAGELAGPGSALAVAVPAAEEAWELPAPPVVFGEDSSLKAAPAKPEFVPVLASELSPDAGVLTVPAAWPAVAPAVAGVAALPPPVAVAAPTLGGVAARPPAAVFKPAAEVYAEVDEQAVEREKAAVRALQLDVRSELTDVAHLEVKACREGGWWYLRGRLTPKSDRLEVVPKDLVVLLDASGSIGEERIKSVREAAKGLLRTAMNSGDRFNLVAFRNRYDYAFRSWQVLSRESFAAGDRWLDALVAYGRTDLFSSIRSVLTLPRDPRRPLMALVVTDGDANEGVWRSSEILSDFTALNDGLISLYMYGVKSEANRPLLTALTRGNRGESTLFDGWRKRQAGNQLGDFTARFRDPLLTDFRLVSSALTPLEAYPARLGNLCRGNPVEFSARLPATGATAGFSLSALAGPVAYESFYRLDLGNCPHDPSAAVTWRRERDLDAALHGGRESN